MDPVVAVQTALLRGAMPELLLREGASVVGRVAARGAEHGVLVLAGVPLTAQLPDEAAAGTTLRLRVREVTPERVTLQLDGPPIPAAAGAPAPPPRPDLPRVAVRDAPHRRREGGEDVASVSLSFTAAALGRLDLRIDLTSGRVEVTADVPAAVHERVQDAAPRLHDGLVAGVGREAAVRVRPRQDPIDVYA